MKMKVLVWLGVMALVAGSAGAVPFGKWFEHRTPEGVVQRIWGEGDEGHATFRNAAGDTLSYNPETRQYERAAASVVTSRLEKVRTRLRAYMESTGRADRWAARKARRSAVRNAAAGSGGSAAVQSVTANDGYDAVSGTVVGVTLLVDFPLVDDDGNVTNTLAAVAHPHVTARDLEEMINGTSFSKYGNVSSCRRYYETVSGGALLYTNVVIGWIQAPHPRAYYDDASQENGACGRSLIGDVFDVLAARSDYRTAILPRLQQATYRTTKKLLTTDYAIRALNVYFAGEEATTWGYGLWAHQYTLAAAQYDRLKVTIDGHSCHFSTYQITPVTSRPSILTFCHENGHMVCDFPDLYHYNGRPGNGVGLWDLMCGRTGTYDTHPQYLSAYLRAAMGWVTPKPLPTDAWVTVTDALDDVYYAANPANAKEYYLIENRQARGFDQEVRASGLAIYRCNEDGDNMYPEALSETARAVFADYGAATNRLSYEVSLEQADGLYSLEAESTNGDAGDAWRADNPSPTYGGVFNATSIPCARWADGSAAAIDLSRFSPNGRTMSFWSAAPAAAASGTSAAAKQFNLALDCDDVRLWTEKANPWFVEADETRDGKSALRSGAVEQGDSSWFWCSFTGKGTLWFDWKVDCSDQTKLTEAMDRLSFFTSTNSGSTAEVKISGTTVAWARKGYKFSGTGAHCVQWRYYNSSSYTAGENCGWLDRIRWVPEGWTGEPIFGTACSYAKASGVLTFRASLQEYGSNTVAKAKATSATARIEVADNSAFTDAKLFEVGALTATEIATFTAVPVFEEGTKCYARLVVTNGGGRKKNGRAYTFTAVTPTRADVAVKPKMTAWHVASAADGETFAVKVTSSGAADETVGLVAECATTADFAHVVRAVSAQPATVPTGMVTQVRVTGFAAHESVYVRLRAVNAAGLSVASAQTVRHDYGLDATDYDCWLKTHGFTTRDYARSSEIAALKTRASRHVKRRADGHVMSVFDEYVAGTDPDDADSVFRAAIAMGPDGPELSWTPDRPDDRVYTVYGKADLADDAWSADLDDTHRFFKVEVSLPDDLSAAIEDRAAADETATGDSTDADTDGDTTEDSDDADTDGATAARSGASVLAVPRALNAAAPTGSAAQVKVAATNDLVQTVRVNVEKVGGVRRITAFEVALKGTVWFDVTANLNTATVSNLTVSATRNFSEAPFLCWAGPKVTVDAAARGMVHLAVPITVDATLVYRDRTLTHSGQISVAGFNPVVDLSCDGVGLDATVFAGLEVGAALGAETASASAKFMQVTVQPGVTGTFVVNGTSVSGTLTPTVTFTFTPVSLELFDRTFEPVELSHTIQGPSLSF